jgi:glycosyltransferase involved in cell wall biosynthesis
LTAEAGGRSTFYLARHFISFENAEPPMSEEALLSYGQPVTDEIDPAEASFDAQRYPSRIIGATRRHGPGMSQGTLSTPKSKPPDLLSIVVPTFNEANVVDGFNERLAVVRRELPLPSEVIFVNDGSSDNTLRRLHRLRTGDPTIGIVDLSRNFGKEIALTAGLDHARGDVVVVIDADLQHPPELIPKFIDRWLEEDADVVYGQRLSRAGESVARKFCARVFYRGINALSDRPIPVDAGDFRLLSRRAVDALSGIRERHRFMKGLFAWIGYRQVPLSFEADARFAGVSKWGYWKLWNFSIDGITSFSIGPLKVATYIGLLVAILAIIYGVYTVIRTMILGNPIPGFPTLLVAILFLGGLQLIFLGIVGEYLGRTFNEVKQRPLYLVRQWQPPEIERRRAAQTASAESGETMVEARPG